MDDELPTATVQIEYHFSCPHCRHHHTDDSEYGPQSPFECEECGREFLLEAEA